MVRANGFDSEQIEGWGPEDKELCARLRHAGGAPDAAVRRHRLAPRASARRARAARRQRGQRCSSTLAQRRVRCVRLDAHL
ncbi:MAG: galactosyltransferase-related protein [Steroidobacteraceae bacterium]